jgi:hypothetical protein
MHRSAKEGVALTIEITATVRTGDADPTGGTVDVAVRKWKQGDSEDGYYYTGAAWQAGATSVESTQGDGHAHTVVVDATRMASLAGFDISARTVEATAIGPTTWVHVSDDFSSVSNDTIAPPAGAKTITITVEDQNTDPVVGVVADVYDASNTTFIKRVTDTDLDGIVAVTLDAATYSVRLSALRFTPDNDPETLVVTVDAAVTYDGTIFVAPVAADADKCTVYGFTTDASGTVIDGVEISFLAAAPIGVDDQQLTTAKLTVTSGDGAWATGYFEIDLIRESEVRLLSTLARLNGIVITIPDAASSTLVALTEAAK